VGKRRRRSNRAKSSFVNSYSSSSSSFPSSNSSTDFWITSNFNYICIHTVYFIINNFRRQKYFIKKMPLIGLENHCPWSVLMCQFGYVASMRILMKWGHESTTRKEKQLGDADSCQMPMLDLLKMVYGQLNIITLSINDIKSRMSCICICKKGRYINCIFTEWFNKILLPWCTVITKFPSNLLLGMMHPGEIIRIRN
jgi:hypothetical protein